MDLVEKIHFNDVPLAYIIRGQLMPDKTTFLTPSDFNQQVGCMAYPADGVIHAMSIVPWNDIWWERPKCLSCVRTLRMDVCDDNRELHYQGAARRRYHAHRQWGHGSRVLEHTVLRGSERGPCSRYRRKIRF